MLNSHYFSCFFYVCRMGKGFWQGNSCGGKWRDSPGGLGWWCLGKPSQLPRVCGGWSGLETGCSQRLDVQCNVLKLQKYFTYVEWDFYIAFRCRSIRRVFCHLEPSTSVSAKIPSPACPCTKKPYSRSLRSETKTSQNLNMFHQIPSFLCCFSSCTSS